MPRLQPCQPPRAARPECRNCRSQRSTRPRWLAAPPRRRHLTGQAVLRRRRPAAVRRHRIRVLLRSLRHPDRRQGNPTTPVFSGTHTISAAGKALDDPNNATSHGTQLITWTPNNGANQNWVFTRQSDGSYQIVNGGFTTPGTTVIQWTCTGGTNQHCTVTKQANNLYKIVKVKSLTRPAPIRARPKRRISEVRW
ncbi:RICIN domain-containing protein [Catenulispora sp. GAS73]|uniref:RICIN domain-containing protein n=1 Tax=Catenulispora sp. GAS73 TaxID=3156269 RepID=UPI00351468CC